MREKTLREMGCIGAQNIRYDFLMVWGDVLSLLCRNVRWKISAHIDEGLSGGSRVHRPGRKDPHQREPKFKSTFNQIFFLLLKLLKRIAGGGWDSISFSIGILVFLLTPSGRNLTQHKEERQRKSFMTVNARLSDQKFGTERTENIYYIYPGHILSSETGFS